MNINKNTKPEHLTNAIRLAAKAGSTHARILRNGTKTAKVISIFELIKFDVGAGCEITFGKKELGLPFDPAPAKKSSVQIARDTMTYIKSHSTPPQPRSLPNQPSSPKPRTGSSFIVQIDLMLMKLGKGVAIGFPRSQYTVEEVLNAMVKAFPGKEPVSIKKIIKARPRHIERQKSRGYGPKNPAPRWAHVERGVPMGD